MKTQPLDIAINLLGGVVACAAAVGVGNYQTVQQWGRNRVPAKYCPILEKATNGQVTCEELRPDLAEQWAYLRGTSKKAA